MSYIVLCRYTGKTDQDGYQVKNTQAEFMDYYVDNQMTSDEYYTAISNNDSSGLWSIYGDDIKQVWTNMYDITWDADLQKLEYKLEWNTEQLYLTWQQIKAGLDYTDEDFNDIDITYTFIDKVNVISP